MNRLNILGVLLALLSGISLAACDGGARSASPSLPIPPHSPAMPATPPMPSAPTAEAAPEEASTSRAASQISDELSKDPNFGAVTLERGKLIISWHGPDTEPIERVREQFPHLSISIRPAACAPGLVRQKAVALMAKDSRVRLAEMSEDMSYLTITISQDADSQDLRHEYETVLGCPVRLKTGDVMPVPEN